MAINFLKRPLSAKGPNVGKKVMHRVVRPEIPRVFMNELSTRTPWQVLNRDCKIHVKQNSKYVTRFCLARYKRQTIEDSRFGRP